MKQVFAGLAVAGMMAFGPAARGEDAASVAPAPMPSATTPAEAGNGTLVVDVRPYTSEKPLPDKADKQLRNGGIEWGLQDHLLVFSSVNKQFVNYPITHLTRFGQNETLTLPAGEYHITGIGLEVSFGFNVMKLLDKGAFLNENTVTFRIEPGHTTTLRIDPVIGKDSAGLVSFYMPTLMMSVVTEGGSSEAKPLNVRGDASIAWRDYHGPLRFAK